MSEATPATIETFDILRLLKSLPHRYPFLMVDRVIEARGDEFGIGLFHISVPPLMDGDDRAEGRGRGPIASGRSH